MDHSYRTRRKKFAKYSDCPKEMRADDKSAKQSPAEEQEVSMIGRQRMSLSERPRETGP